jgi:hypothetical protein
MPKNPTSDDPNLDLSTLHPLFWLFSIGLKPQFTQADILKLAPGLSASTLQNWANRDLLRPVIEIKQVTGRRLYDGGQLLSAVLGHQLVEDFGLPPLETIATMLAANMTVTRAWRKEALPVARTLDKKVRVAFLNERLEEYWVVRPKKMTDIAAVKAPFIPETLARLGACIIFPHGRYLKDVAERAMALKQESAR